MNLNTNLIYLSTAIVLLVCLGLVIFSAVSLYKNPSHHAHSYGTQTVKIYGRVKCCRWIENDTQPECLDQVRSAVELYESDMLSSDDLLNETLTDTNGKFWISGSEYELLSAEFYLKIHHNCDMDTIQNHGEYIRHSYYKIPDYYINSNMTFLAFITLNNLGSYDYVRKYHY